MTVNPSQAVAAYAQTAAKAARGGADAKPDQAGSGFAELVSGSLNDAINAGRSSERVSMQAVANQADINEIVTAVTNAEVTLQTVVAIRDRIIQAYQDIIRMPI